MTMVCGLDLHRRQITFDAQDLDSGQVWTGRVWQPDRERFRRWLRDDVTEHAHGGPVGIAVEGCTGWRYVVEEVVAAGFEAHLAEPADTQAARGRKRRAKTDRSDCRLLRELLAEGRLPASWIAPTIVLEWRERARLYKTLVDQRSTWVQRIHAELYQHGVTLPETSIRWAKTRELLEDNGLEISPAGRQRVLTAYRMIDAITIESRPLKADLQRFGRRQPGCRALVEHQYGIGGLLALVLWSERATASGSPAPNRWCATVAWTSPSTSRIGDEPAGSSLVKPPDVALGALRSRQERLASAQPRPRLLRRRERPSQRQAGHHLDGPQARPPLLPHAASRRPRRRP
jgi:transposase